jgi:hypothetical protein
MIDQLLYSTKTIERLWYYRHTKIYKNKNNTCAAMARRAFICKPTPKRSSGPSFNLNNRVLSILRTTMCKPSLTSHRRLLLSLQLDSLSHHHHYHMRGFISKQIHKKIEASSSILPHCRQWKAHKKYKMKKKSKNRRQPSKAMTIGHSTRAGPWRWWASTSCPKMTSLDRSSWAKKHTGMRATLSVATRTAIKSSTKVLA